MKIAAINCNHFTGEKSKAGKVKTAASAAAVALAVAAPVKEADAQILYPVPPAAMYQYYVPSAGLNVNVPNCFIYGDMENFDYNKSMKEVFTEIDSGKNPNRELSVNEVLRRERNNWNMFNLYPMNVNQMELIAARFNILSNLYNEEGSNPKTISYSEYKTIMNDYMRAKNVRDFFMLMNILSHPSYRRPMVPTPPQRPVHPYPQQHPPYRHR